MIPVKSSTVIKRGYEEESKTLHILYRTGLYQWVGVEEGDYAGLVDTPSKGKYMKEVIEVRYGKGTKLTPTKNPAGFLVESTTVQTNNPIRSDVSEAHCPKCGGPAAGFAPPMADVRYTQRLEQEKELNKLTTDEDAHNAFLKASGGYVEICKCGTSYFVPARSAKVKA